MFYSAKIYVCRALLIERRDDVRKTFRGYWLSAREKRSGSEATHGLQYRTVAL